MDMFHLSRVFLKLGTIGFGGPAAHIALMRSEFVEKRSLFNDQEFLDLLGAVNLIPGPNSTELAIHIGRKIGGKVGMVVAGMSFIFPAFILVVILAILYKQFGSLPQMTPLLAGIRPVMLAIILQALWKFRFTAIKTNKDFLIFFISLLAVLYGVDEIFILLVAGILSTGERGTLAVIPLATSGMMSSAPSSLGIFSFFLKVGSVLFGSGYVLIAYLKNDLVDGKGWLTDTQLLDSITVGQVTPGPVFTTATFIGHILLGLPGAVLATIAIFLPGFIFVALTAPLLEKLRNCKKLARFLDGVNSASFALMSGALIKLGYESLTSISAIIFGVLAFLILWFTKTNSALVILFSAISGYIIL